MEKKISILGVPMDLGQSRRGVDMGPSAIRYAGIVERLQRLGYTVQDLGNIAISEEKNNTSSEQNLNNLHAIVKTNEALASKVDEIVKNNEFPLVFGGDHSISIGTLAGISQNYQNLGVIWYDAHGDLNVPETSPSGNIHGMPLASSMGFGHELLTNIAGFAPKVKPENVVMIGVRDLDQGEKVLIKKLGLKVYSMHEIDRLGMARVIEETIEYLKDKDGVHLSLDLDALDPTECPGVGTPVIGGVTYRESHLAMEMLAESNLITSAEFVEVNPILDEKNKTADVAATLMGSLFGEKILEPSGKKVII
ncbi:arginase [Compostibacillus humi]|uniref:Arginase n=1 Tax=Compostibacillus humi TaxID=1245525 RepID=A0A8J2ZS88_9BACI|nr:arginase [Compostibacillus humi]GGH74419.1 arginase [Compostibacillus humi]HLT56958.1 arginase [Bacillota bacterium]